MLPPGPCDEAYPAALARGEVIECEKTTRHWKHENLTVEAPGSILWWGPGLSDDEREEAQRIRNMGQGGKDPFKQLAWVMQLVHELEEGTT